tara:strand:+ start:170 stop:799 length:630 start_codon:yes stop_codon:yes gene_type:complete
MAKKIAWEKWEDNVEEHSSQKMLAQLFSEQNPNAEEEDIDINDIYSGFMSELPTLVSSPVGVYKLHDRMSPTKQFDCWMGYTNFDITEDTKDKIESVPGVELLVVLTRYRFFIGVAKLFKFRDVRVSIEQFLCNNEQENLVEDKNVQKEIDTIKKSISENEHWAIFVFPNGEIDYVSSNEKNDDAFLEKLILYNEARVASGGLVIHSEE